MPVGEKNGWLCVDAVVDDPDLDSLARGRQGRPPDLRRADRLRAAEELALVAHARVDVRDPGKRGDPGRGARGREHREPVEDDLVAPAHGRARNRSRETRLEPLLVARDRAQVRRPGTRVHREAGLRQRGLLEQHDLLDEAPARRCRAGRGGGGERQRETDRRKQEKTPVQAEKGTQHAATLSVRADVAELVDAHGSGPCGGNPVEVQVLSSASVRRAGLSRG